MNAEVFFRRQKSQIRASDQTDLPINLIVTQAFSGRVCNALRPRLQCASSHEDLPLEIGLFCVADGKLCIGEANNDSLRGNNLGPS